MSGVVELGAFARSPAVQAMYEVRLSTVNVSGVVVLPTRARSAGRLPPVTVTWSVVGVAPGATASVPLKTNSWARKCLKCGVRCE